VFVVAFFVSLFAVTLNELVVPAANTAYNNVVFYEIQRNTTPKSQDHIVIKDVDGGQINRLTYARKFDEATNTMIGVSIEEFETISWYAWKMQKKPCGTAGVGACTTV